MAKRRRGRLWFVIKEEVRKLRSCVVARLQTEREREREAERKKRKDRKGTEQKGKKERKTDHYEGIYTVYIEFVDSFEFMKSLTHHPMSSAPKTCSTNSSPLISPLVAEAPHCDFELKPRFAPDGTAAEALSLRPEAQGTVPRSTGRRPRCRGRSRRCDRDM